ncbi:MULTISPECIES: hypothetical protein [unclassified Synechocystis]|uniref:hypothetical protein n=1 Tax=unclassified Synechocystis TaxID=2640012 RepID=UPI00041D6359|nr:MULTISPECIES: hypothetical protein [unclassified Synechocystis]AIE75010.1 hypothetical protein D082_24820 [Synechocystis sp. PCC 6714]MCT0253283.1 hypothetical protein [Synechocystis sp. CS-94]
MDIGEQLLLEVLSVSIWSLSISLIVGGAIGLIIGIIKKRIKFILLPAILGSFLGTLIIAFIPLFSIPELVNGGAYAGVFVLPTLIVLVPFGSIVSGILGGLSGVWTANLQIKNFFFITFFLAYLLLILGILIRLVLFKAG